MGSRVWIDGCGRLEVFEAPDDVFEAVAKAEAESGRAHEVDGDEHPPWMDLRTIHGGIATLRADMIAVVEEYNLNRSQAYPGVMTSGNTVPLR